MGDTWERYEGIWHGDFDIDPPPTPAAGEWGYKWRLNGFADDLEADASLGTRDGLLDDRCYRVTSDVWAVRSTRSDGTMTSIHGPETGLYAVSFCDLECGELPEPFPTGFFNRMVD